MTLYGCFRSSRYFDTMARADLYAIFGVTSLTPHHLPYRVLTDTQPLRSVFYCANLSVGLPHPLLEGRISWVGAQRLPCLLEVPRHRGAVEAEARGDLCHRLPRLVQRHHLFHQLRTQIAVDPPRLGGGRGCPCRYARNGSWWRACRGMGWDSLGSSGSGVCSY